MKYISQHSDRLSLAFRRIEELEEENLLLRKELNGLRTTREQRTFSSTPSPSTNEQQPRYARPTEASCSRDKSVLQSSNESKSMRDKTISISGAPYVYQAGVPIPLPPPGPPDWWCCQVHFLKGTEASKTREEASQEERYERKQRQEEIEKRRISSQKPPLPELSRCSSCVDLLGDPTDKVAVDRPCTSNFSAAEDKLPIEESSSAPSDNPRALIEDLAKRSRLRDFPTLKEPIVIDSKLGFGCLRRAFEIAQEVVCELAKNGGPRWQDRDYEEGPHLVKLGRDELMGWMDNKRGLIYNGVSGAIIEVDLVNVVGLRNALCHPEVDTFRNPPKIDYFVRNAQSLAVTLRNEKAAMELREIRETVYKEARKVLQDLRDMYFFSLQPDYQEPEYQLHHVLLLRRILWLSKNTSWGGSSEEQEFLTIAEAWQNSQKPE
ncbi:hypothetical protein F5Y14DRAFT_452195 [Nemania sp. NC0429]|nr:hypothetical protein F5Y14DRAFT_452195 [Nemania sp. NC0429]